LNTDKPLTETKPPESPQPQQTPDEAKPRRGGSAAAGLALLLALAALAGTAWMWWQDQSAIGQEEERLLAEIARLENRDNSLDEALRALRETVTAQGTGGTSAAVEALQARADADRAQLEKAEQAVSEQLALSRSLQQAADALHGRLLAAEAALAGMSVQAVDAGSELDLAEVDYLLRLAHERLQLFADPPAADRALEVADSHLAALDNPVYLGVRREIATARSALKALQMPDYLQIASGLDAVQNKLPTLPFPQPEAASTASGDGGDGDGSWWARLKATLAGLVTVRRSSLEEQVLSLEDKDYIRQRIWLQLEIAHLALMRREEEDFRRSLERARESVATWFDPADAAVQQVQSDLAALAALEIEVEMPDITAAWTTLRAVRASTPAPAASGAPSAAAGAEGAPPAEDGTGSTGESRE
jgi:uroporphyrin-3 C-methyltransferase